MDGGTIFDDDEEEEEEEEDANVTPVVEVNLEDLNCLAVDDVDDLDDGLAGDMSGVTYET